MSSDVIPVPAGFAGPHATSPARSRRDCEYEASIADPGRSGRYARRKAPGLDAGTDQVRDVGDGFSTRNDFRIRWFADGELNASVNCLDRHLAERGDKTALIFEPDDPDATANASATANCIARVQAGERVAHARRA